MTSFTVQLDDDAADRLRRRAERLGVDVAVLAGRLLAEASEQDLFEFVGSFESGVTCADDVDSFPREHDFGTS